MLIKIRHKLYFLTQTILVILVCTNSLWAQKAASFSDSLLTLGNRALAQKRFAAAEDFFKKTLKYNSESPQALAGLGKSVIAQGKWQDASEYFNRLLEQDPTQTEAHYYLGIAYREMGKYKALLLRKLDWDKIDPAFSKGDRYRFTISGCPLSVCPVKALSGSLYCSHRAGTAAGAAPS